MPSTSTSAPASRRAARSAQRFESGIWPRPGVLPTSTSSSPVDMRATRGRRRTGSSARPVAAAIPSSAAPSCAPAERIRSPSRRSSPIRWKLLPARSDAGTVTVSPETWTSSTMTMQSAPSGTTPPVRMRAAVPAGSELSKGRPAADSPTTRRVLPASAARTA